MLIAFSGLADRLCEWRACRAVAGAYPVVLGQLLLDGAGGLGQESAVLANVDAPCPERFDPARPEAKDHNHNAGNGPDAENHGQGWIDPDPEQGGHHPQTDQ